MAEIKSTLDLVMEKTRNLSLSPEERADQKNKEIRSQIRGLIQKFQDQTISSDRFESDYRILLKDFNLSEDDLLIKEICRQIEPGKDNTALFGLLVQFKVSELDGITSALQDFEKTLNAAAEQRSKTIKDELAKAHHIFGSAVVPNLDIDEVWQENREQIKAEFEKKLEQAKNRLLGEHS